MAQIKGFPNGWEIVKIENSNIVWPGSTPGYYIKEPDPDNPGKSKWFRRAFDTEEAAFEHAKTLLYARENPQKT